MQRGVKSILIGGRWPGVLANWLFEMAGGGVAVSLHLPTSAHQRGRVAGSYWDNKRHSEPIRRLRAATALMRPHARACVFKLLSNVERYQKWEWKKKGKRPPRVSGASRDHFRRLSDGVIVHRFASINDLIFRCSLWAWMLMNSMGGLVWYYKQPPSPVNNIFLEFYIHFLSYDPFLSQTGCWCWATPAGMQFHLYE